MSGKDKILIVEDDKRLNSYLMTLMSSQGYDVLSEDAGGTAISTMALHSPDLLLLDLGLPDMDGLEVLRQIREWTDIPVIILSSRQTELDKIEGLDSGANDYITKPFGSGELLARIRNAIRTHRRVASTGGATGSRYKNGEFTIDFEKRVVTVGGCIVHLTPIEYKIVALFARNPGKVLTHDYLIQHLWGAYAGDSQLLRVNIANIRRKLEINPAMPNYIVTEVGVGYRMREING